ncbi:MAG: hypothetical protein KIS80_02555 [Anaerolineales bacterium]|nr:hypothetical protein [Anaerolineales bacterium]
MSEVLSVLGWYLLLAGLGWLTLPLGYRFFGALADKGYAFLRPLSLLLWGFLCWLLGSYGLLPNNPAGILSATLLLGGLSWWAARGLQPGELRDWLRSQRGTLLAMETLFLLAFVFMAWVRSASPQIYHTEQPMELAFINAILRSPAMPPHDPWMSGFSISYYYFGYLMVAMLAQLLKLSGSLAFNLGFVSIFACAALAAYGLAYNLLMVYKPRLQRSLLWLASLAPLLVLLLGNGGALLELAHARHALWAPDAEGALQSRFWIWLDVDELSSPPVGEPSWAPRHYDTDFWWWWRSSRIINDRDLSGNDQEVIDEFPAFSFTLGDLHPHVLSMPFVLLATGLALNLYLGGGVRRQPLPTLGFKIQAEDLAFAIVLLGGLAFLNIWDFPIYAALYGLAYLLRQGRREGWRWEHFIDLLALGMVLLVGGVAAYLPFYLGFTSQAGGILPNLINPSRGAHLWIMFGWLWLPLLAYLLWLWKGARWQGLGRGLLYGLALAAGLWLLSVGLAGLYAGLLPDSALGQAVAALGGGSLGEILVAGLQRRAAAIGGSLSLAALLGLCLGLLSQKPPAKKIEPQHSPMHAFVLLMVFMGALLVTAPEFIYLRDQFGTRMNTVFKFYFQAWQLWAVAAAVGAVVLLSELRRVWRAAFAGLMTLVLAAGLLFPLYSFSQITRNPVGSLDGSAHLPADTQAAIAWLQAAPLGVLAEAVGASYDSSTSRFSAFSGQPTLMGWPGHEGQWRGGNVDWTRMDQLRTLYSTSDWRSAQLILEEYNIQYVVVGPSERASYPVNEEKFAQNLRIAFQSESITIYQAP